MRRFSLPRSGCRAAQAASADYGAPAVEKTDTARRADHLYQSPFTFHWLPAFSHRGTGAARAKTVHFAGRLEV
jgi:hypothetical protein